MRFIVENSRLIIDSLDIKMTPTKINSVTKRKFNSRNHLEPYRFRKISLAQPLVSRGEALDSLKEIYCS